MNETIETLSLSVRAYNALKKSEIYTIEQLINQSPIAIYNLENIGKKTATEIMGIIEFLIEQKNPNQIEKTFLYNKIRYVDTKIIKLPISTRLYNVLAKQNILYISEILLNQAQFNNQIMGAKTLLEFDEMITNLKLIKATNTSINISLCDKIITDLNIQNSDQISDIYKYYEKCLDYQQFYKTITTQTFFRKIIQEKLLNIAQQNLSLDDLTLDEISLSIIPPQEINNILIELINENKIQIIDEILFYNYQTILQSIKKILIHSQAEVLLKRLEGKTLQEIGDLKNVSRERIRQIEKKSIKKIKATNQIFKEDIYKYIFQKYEIPKDFFENKLEYNYLNAFYKKGTNPLESALSDKNIFNHQKIQIEKWLYREYIIIDNIYVKKTKSSLLKFAIQKYAVNQIIYDDFLKNYNQFIITLNLENIADYNEVGRGQENMIFSSNIVLSSLNRKIRYYDLSNVDFTQFLNVININHYQDVEISTQKIYNNNLQLMQEYNVLDHYELHNLLKKINNNPNIIFKKMPIIEIGQCNRNNQIINLIQQTAPISQIKLIDLYTKLYGIAENTFIANYLPLVSNFYKDKKYITEEYKEGIKEPIKQFLTEEFHTIINIKEKLHKHNIKYDNRIFNNKNMNEIGYNVNESCIVSSKYKSNKDYFHQKLNEKQIFNINELGENIKTITQLYYILKEYKENYILLEYQPDKYINISKLNEKGYTIDDIKDYIISINNFNNKKYFTIESLKNQGFNHMLNELGFENYFYASIIQSSKKYISRATGKNKIFTTDKIFEIKNLFYQIIKETGNLEITDFINHLIKCYNIYYPKDKIIQIIQNSNMYYSVIYNKIYIDYEVYFNEI